MKWTLAAVLSLICISASAQMKSDGYYTVNLATEEKVEYKEPATGTFLDEGLDVRIGETVTQYRHTDRASIGKAEYAGLIFSMFNFVKGDTAVIVGVSKIDKGVATVIIEGDIMTVFYFKQSKIEQI